MGNELSVEIQNKINAAAQQYESATQHEGLGPSIFKAGVEYAMAYAKVTADKELQAQVNELDAIVNLFDKLGDCVLVRDSIVTYNRKKALQQFKDGKGKEVENEG